MTGLDKALALSLSTATNDNLFLALDKAFDSSPLPLDKVVKPAVKLSPPAANLPAPVAI